MVDSAGSSVVGVGLVPFVAVCRGESPEVSAVQHNTTVIIRSPTPAPVPDTATYIEKMEAMKNEKAEGKDNRSFLAKYWMYIIPVVLIMLFSGGGQEGAR
ncbi:ER membrane protein complex subunit 10-like [Macrobrachium nipponense]|uniref:ER membrane protein complex subunit 10-like n=1 Tax=Macrobrachium nipponense TaxID=159736 RepID=UPI0030C8CAE1